MQRTLCKSKMQIARITGANLRYEGSITIDADLLDAADVVPYERLQVVNLNNGARLETYCLPGERGTGTVCLNGAAARQAAVGDEVLIISYALMETDEIAAHCPTVVSLDQDNRIRDIQTNGHQHMRARAQRIARGRRSVATR